MAAKPAARRTKKEGLPQSVGTWPHRVWVGPRAAKGGVLYLRWSRGKHSAWKSLRVSLAGKSATEARAIEKAAYQAALDQYERLTGRRAPDAQATATAPLRIGDAWALLTDAKHGRYPTDSLYRREFKAALATAARILGEDFPWTAFSRLRLREVTRRHLDAVMKRGGVGFRASQVLGTRLCTIARVLQEEGHLPETYAVPGGKAWIGELKTYSEAKRGDAVPAPHRPRYTLAELRALIAIAPQVDPRFGLMMALGAELRAGQVARAKRSHVDLVRGQFTVTGRGKKGGTVVDLTGGQIVALYAALEVTPEKTGYLAACESLYTKFGTDYVLFPSALGAGRMAQTGHTAIVDKAQVGKWVRAAETLAGIPHVAGRSWYGGRRASVDASLDEGISGEGLEASGGWTNPRTPNEIYRERGRQSARTEARDVRARVRGEVPAAAPALVLDPATVAEVLRRIDALEPDDPFDAYAIALDDVRRAIAPATDATTSTTEGE